MKWKEIIREAIERVVGEMEFVVEHPNDENMGDYATNVALILAKRDGKNPRDLAQEISFSLAADIELMKIVEKVEVAGPGFVNFWIKEVEIKMEMVSEILKKGSDYGRNEIYKGKKVMVEYTDPNPFKQFHIGHLMSNAIGESVSRLVEFSGAEVKRACYQGDVGMHVAKAIWGMLKMDKEVWTEEGGEMIKLMGEAYTAGSKAFEEDETAKKEIEELNKKIYEKSDEEINQLYSKGRKWSLEYFEQIYQILGTKYDHYFFESEMSKPGVEVVKNNPQVFEESQGAMIFRGENYGLHTRVFVNALGLPTYEAKELALAFAKKEAYDYDWSIVITGNEINDYFKVLLKAMELIYPDLAVKTKHLGHGMLRLKTGKMSSRTGQVITGFSLYQMIFDSVKERMEDKDDEIAKKIAVAAVKYPMIRQGIERDVIYDENEAVSTDGDTGPYLQYVCVRAWAVQKEIGEKDYDISWNKLMIDELERKILRWIYRFPEVVEEAAIGLKPHLLADYLFELGQRYNTFYNQDRIKGSEKEGFRLLLSLAAAQIVKNGLNLLGIETVERM